MNKKMNKKKAEVKAREAVIKKDELMRGKEIRKKALFVIVFLLSFIYIMWRLFFTLPLQYGLASMIWGVILWLCEAETVLETFTHFNNVRKVKIPDMPVIPDEMYPDVDVLIATHNEDVDLLYKTLNGCKYMHYPDKSKVHIYLCDDKNRPEVKQLTEHLGVGYFGFDGNKYAKAGNLNNALPHIDSPLIAIFDADMIPTHDFLLETVPYFFLRDMIFEDNQWRKRIPEQDGESDDQELGYVQTQQSFYNPDPFQKNLYMENSAPNEQDYFYRSVNVARMHTNSAAFAGSNTVFSRKALEEAGWFETHSITEDFATSISILGKGYRTIAVAKELAHGLCPEDVQSFIKQRKRWSRGAAQGIMTKKFWCSGMPLKAKWNFLSAYFYWWTFLRRLVFILAPILYGVFHIHIADVSFWALMLVWLPYYIIYNRGLKKMSGGTTNALWSDRIDTIQFPYMIWPIIAGTLMIPQKKFVVTSKDVQKGKNSNFSLATPHIILLALSMFTVLVCSRDIVANGNEGSIIVLFWAIYNIFALTAAIVYYAGRNNNRRTERIPIEANVLIKLKKREIIGTSVDLSEGGLGVKLDFPEYIPPDDLIDIEISARGYLAHMKIQIRHIRQYEKNWYYSFEIVEIEEASKQEYLQILYDRAHSFSRLIDTGVVKDIKRMYRGLSKDTKRSERRLPRVDLNISIQAFEVPTVRLVNFNYKYILLRSESSLPEVITLLFPGNIKLSCFKDIKMNQSLDSLNRNVMYQLDNWMELAQQPAFHKSLSALIDMSRSDKETQDSSAPK